MGRTTKQASRSVSTSCRNHGSCSWCTGNRTHQQTKALSAGLDALDTLLDDMSLIPEEILITPTLEATQSSPAIQEPRSSSICIIKITLGLHDVELKAMNLHRTTTDHSHHKRPKDN